MGRTLRLTYKNALHHVTMRCNNKEFLFREPSFLLFLDVLRETTDKLGVRLYNYCLMTNHIHLLFDVQADDVLPKFMHRLANVFAKKFNAMRQRKGHLWEGRYRSTVVEPSTFFLQCMAYIDLNPVRARMVTGPGEYRWSAYRDIAAENQAMIKLHRSYLELGKDTESRRRAYSQILEQETHREPFSLAEVLFVGDNDFVWRMRERFGIAEGSLPRVELAEMDGGVRAVKLRKPCRPAE